MEEHLIDKLRDGVKMCDVYNSTLNMCKKERPELVDKLTKNFGFVMGIEFREGSLTIGPSCTAVVKKGMVFNVNIGIQGISNKEAKDPGGREVAFFIGDTVLVNEVGYFAIHPMILNVS